MNTEKVRINKFLASLGIASRRKIDEMILMGKIKINNKVITQLGTKINPNKDIVEVDNKKIQTQQTENFTYIILNKPKGIIATASDTHYRKTVLDIVNSKQRLYPVGRLDQDSRGLILLTNDGKLTYALTHPKYHVPKTYEVKILGNVKDSIVEKLRNGVELEEGKTAKADIKICQRNVKQSLLEITLYEGKKRQIRRMCAALHLFLIDLRRIK